MTTQSNPTDDETNAIVAAFAIGGIIVVSVPAMVILYGYCLASLWGWFLVPFGAPPISIAWAIGLIAVRGIVIPTPSSKPKSQRPWSDLFDMIAKPLIILAVGYIAHLFMVAP